MNEMVEKVASVLFDQEYSGPYSKVLTHAIFGCDKITYAEVKLGIENGLYTAAALSNVHALARATIEAMREPTKEMLEAGWEHTDDPCWREDVAEAWRAMIDAALKS